MLQKEDIRAIASNYIIWIMIAVALLAIVMIFIFSLKNQGLALIDNVKNMFSGR